MAAADIFHERVLDTLKQLLQQPKFLCSFFFSSFDDFPGRLFSNGGTMRVIISCNFFSSSVNENTVNNPGSALKQT